MIVRGYLFRFDYKNRYLYYILKVIIFYFQLDPSRGFAVFAKINYDALNERVSIVEEIIEEIKDKEKKMFYEEILLHQEVQWEVEWYSIECRKTVTNHRGRRNPINQLNLKANIQLYVSGFFLNKVTVKAYFKGLNFKWL